MTWISCPPENDRTSFDQGPVRTMSPSEREIPSDPESQLSVLALRISKSPVEETTTATEEADTLVFLPQDVAVGTTDRRIAAMSAAARYLETAGMPSRLYLEATLRSLGSVISDTTRDTRRLTYYDGFSPGLVDWRKEKPAPGEGLFPAGGSIQGKDG